MLATDFIDSLTLRASGWAFEGVRNDKEFLENEIAKWKTSPQRMMQITGDMYYEGDQDILRRERTMIGDDGKLEIVHNLPNNRVVDNQYAKLVTQKTDYLLGQPFVVDGENKEYVDLLKDVFDKKFMKTMKNACTALLNNGIAWLYPYYAEDGSFAFRLFPGYEILPFWQDREHTELDLAVRLYLTVAYEGTEEKVVEHVEVYDTDGIHRFILDGGVLVPDVESGDPDAYHVTTTDADGILQGFNWTKIPLIPLKYNEQEIPLIKRVKSLQDGINIMISDFENNLQEDARNTILIIKNYDGTDLGEFRRNLAAYGAVKVRYDNEVKGGVEPLEIKVNADNYKAIIEIFKKALIENGMGYDAKDDRLSGNPNQMNIQSMYSDIDLDADGMETELQAAFDDILWFVDAYLANAGYGDFSNEEVRIVFNRDILINETEAIQNCLASVGLLSTETILGQHPWVNDVQLEMDRLTAQDEEEQQRIESQYNPFERRDDEVDEE